MLQISIAEVFFRAFPEQLLLILSAYLLSYRTINKKMIFISSFILTLMVFVIRMLPIYYGVHTIINIMVYILILVLINKINIIVAIPISLVVPVILSICEGINFIIIKYIFGIKIQLINNSAIKILCFMPSLILFSIIILIFYELVYKNKKEDDNNVLS